MHEKIQLKLEQKFKPSYINLLNESHMHAGPATESHFNLVMVSETFEGQSLLQRQRAVFTLLKDEMTQIHALTMQLHTAKQWENSLAPNNSSPKCLGDSQSSV